MNTNAWYFIAYFFTDHEGKQGYGSIEVELLGAPARHSDLDAISNGIKGKLNLRAVTILNWRRFDEL